MPGEIVYDDNEDDFIRDEKFKPTNQANPTRDASETMRSERENYITVFEHNRLHSGNNIQTERVPERNNLKPIINASVKLETEPDFSPNKSISPIKDIYAENINDDNQNYEIDQKNPFASMTQPLNVRKFVVEFNSRSAQLR